MIGVWLEQRRLSLREDLPEPAPGEDEAVVRVTLAGICNTDLELVRGYYPFTGVPGHEFVGVVDAGPPELLGRRVVGEINARPPGCGCEACRAGRTTHCERRTVLGIVGRDGAFAQRLALPAENLHPVPDGVPDEAAVFVEPLAAALRIREQIDVEPDDRVLVVGDGKLGQLIARALAATGCRLTVAGRHEAKLAPLRRLGIAAVAASELDRAGPFDVAVDAAGNPGGFDLARRALRPGGTLVMKSTYAGRLELDASSLVVDEITVVGSRCGPFSPALELLARGELDPRPLISARYPLSEALAALDHAAQRGALKVLLRMPETT
ncbi:MAG: alcohol dehydrogenase catalytic domain-containing protein [Thermoanaerobaculia bacterium]|nr:alcohol dehydrogenase catalytic domain-containing protein [Thermoanaerobaculia bacterium]